MKPERFLLILDEIDEWHIAVREACRPASLAALGLTGCAVAVGVETHSIALGTALLVAGMWFGLSLAAVAEWMGSRIPIKTPSVHRP
ncbi:MAG: hypothetical protein AAF610_13075 [Pseudomonadota bacterium]